jgi:hypothetical protein
MVLVNITEEKKYLFEMMKDITAERRSLTELYFGLKERLDELNKLEQRGLEDLSIKGYVDLYNKTNAEVMTTNLKRESEHLIKKIEKDNNIEESRLQVKIKEEIKEEDNKKPVRRGKAGKSSNERYHSAILEVLKEGGKPLSINELLSKVNEMLDDNIKKSHFSTNLIPNAMKKYNKIDRPMRGFYQYKF